MLDLEPTSIMGLTVTLTRLDEAGWEEERKAWYQKYEKESWQNQTLAQFLATELSVPGPEATALAHDILGPWVEEWKLRGGREEATKVGRFTLALVASLAALVILASVAIGLLVWLFLT